MDALTLFTAMIAALIVLGVVAAWFGIDSRDDYGDDWARSGRS
jgi:hypothetical protein